MKKGYPAAPWDGIYTCSQLATLGRQEVVGLPKSDEAYKSVHKTLSNPILVQMALTHSPMMAVLDSCVQPGLSDLVKQEAGLARAYVWLSLELLRKLCLRQVPNCADFLALQELAKDERDPNVAVCMAASELWRKSTNVSWEMLAYRTPKYAEEVEPNYAAVFKSYVLPLLLRHLETRPHVVWRHEEIVGASRFCLSTVGLHLLHSQHAAVAELGRAMIVYSMLPLTSPTGGEFGFTPEAVLPSRSVFRVLYNQVWSTVGSFGAQLLGFALNRYSALLGDHARHSMPTGDYTKCCCSGTDALVHRSDTGELSDLSCFRFAQVAEAAYSILHLQHDTPFETAINLLKKPCGVGAAFNAKWIQQKIPCLATCAEGKLKQDFIQASQKLRSYLGQREHQDLAQNEFLEHHFPFASEILQKFLKGVDLHTWFFAQSPSAKKPLPALALGYGFYYCIYQLLLVIPLLTYCQSARDLFDLAYSMVPEADFWFKSEHYMDVLNQPVQSLHIQVQPGVVATISHASSSAVAQVKTPHLPLEVSVQPSVTAAPRRSTPKRKGKSAAPARPDQPLFFFNVPKISGDVEVQGSAAPATLQDLNPPCILPEGSSSNNQGPIPTAGPSSRPAPQQLQPPAWPQPEHRVNLGPRDTTPKYQPLTTTKDIVTAYSQQVATDYELPAQLLHNHYAQLYAVRDQPSLLLTFPADPKPTLEALAAEAIEVLDKLSLDRRWFLRSLVAKIKVEMDTGADGMYYTLGPTVNAHKDAYTRRMAKTLMSMNLGITESAAINEALRIAHGDGMHSSNLVFWDPTSGRVELNLEPMLPACIKDEYTGPKQILIGQVEQYEHSSTQAKIDCLLPFLYGPGPSEQQSHERVEKMLHHSDVVGTLRITGSGNPMERATKKSKAMRGDAASAFSTGRFFGNAVVPWIVHKEDDQFNHLKEVVTTLDVQLKSESQKRAQDFVANFLPEIFPGVQWMAGGCLTDSMELDDLYDEM
ncbi:hypothetical protein FRC09_006057 [Ceratobasidium sp. 395]|nr:hypothetical protein FRC09_006057 [Ceratobasidium sp. 395]